MLEGAGVTVLRPERADGVSSEVYDTWSRETPTVLPGAYPSRHAHRTSEPMPTNPMSPSMVAEYDDEFEKRHAIKSKILQLESLKASATHQEDYTKAHEYKMEIERVKSDAASGALHLSPPRVRRPPSVNHATYSAF